MRFSALGSASRELIRHEFIHSEWPTDGQQREEEETLAPTKIKNQNQLKCWSLLSQKKELRWVTNHARCKLNHAAKIIFIAYLQTAIVSSKSHTSSQNLQSNLTQFVCFGNVLLSLLSYSRLFQFSFVCKLRKIKISLLLVYNMDQMLAWLRILHIKLLKMQWQYQLRLSPSNFEISNFNYSSKLPDWFANFPKCRCLSIWPKTWQETKKNNLM